MDKNAPALIIANGESCSPALLQRLLAAQPLVVVLDGALPRVQALGIQPHAWLGDFDSHRSGDLPAIPDLAIVHAPDQNKTDLQKGLEYLIGRGVVAANVVWATGRRADHTLSNLTDLVRYHPQLAITLLDDYSRVYCLPRSFVQWYAQGTPLSLMPVGTVTGLTTQGLVYNLANATLRLGYFTSSSNQAATDGLISVQYTDGDLLMMECHDHPHDP